VAEDAAMTRTISLVGLLMMIGGLFGLVLRREAFSTAATVLALQACAVALMAWARLTFGLRSFHPTAAPTSGGLVTNGPYRWIRHPIYTSVCLFAWACVVGHASWAAAGMAAVVTAGAVARVMAEEAELPGLYPEYREYSRRTKRMVPGVF
jgi:protein-S-isoprenylcysteine O-methyltransferase Ste14